MACIIGKTVTITGDYFTSLGAQWSINRTAEISADLFKVKEQGTDGLAEGEGEDPKVETWYADQLTVLPGERTGEGILEEECFDVSYTRGPFPGPSGNCTLTVKATVCDQCTIEDTSWELKCDVEADGSGGRIKARGTWSVQ